MKKRTRPYRSGYFFPSENGTIKKVKLRNPNKTIWDSVKDFINNLKINEEFTRQGILKHIYKSHCDQSTVDTYKHQLMTLGIIELIKPGRYIKVKRIPKTLSTKTLRELSSKKSWKSWFIDTDFIE